jgi:predicted RNase H-like nuclease/GrpB-like predicted nucleotidyltransferase (UPF0157 family)
MPFPDEPSSTRVEVAAPDPAWADEATTYVDLLRTVVPWAVSIDHIGSTSVPGLPAKNCLDLMVQVDELDEHAIASAMSARGFRLRPEPWNRDEVTDGVSHPKLVFAPAVGSRSVNVHVRVSGGRNVRNVRYALLFRDFLRADAAARDAWGGFKTRLAQSVTDLLDYGQIKAAVQPLLMERAEQWAARTGWQVTSSAPGDGPPVLGVDGCRAGWVGALLRGSTYDVLVAADIAGLVDAARQIAPGLAVVAVDIPIGLPDDRPRTTDVLARSQLPVGRKSSVFPTPSRAAVQHTTHTEASTANREALGVGLSVQAFHLVPKILDVDRYVEQHTPVPVIEAHPEVTFAEIDPACVVPSKATVEGQAARRGALSAVGLDPPGHHHGQGYAGDDLLDACAVAWTAARYASGTAYSLPDPPEVFSDGIAAAIWV